MPSARGRLPSSSRLVAGRHPPPEWPCASRGWLRHLQDEEGRGRRVHPGGAQGGLPPHRHRAGLRQRGRRGRRDPPVRHLAHRHPRGDEGLALQPRVRPHAQGVQPVAQEAGRRLHRPLRDPLARSQDWVAPAQGHHLPEGLDAGHAERGHLARHGAALRRGQGQGHRRDQLLRQAPERVAEDLPGPAHGQPGRVAPQTRADGVARILQARRDRSAGLCFLGVQRLQPAGELLRVPTSQGCCRGARGHARAGALALGN
mmetsp:Transcript_89174/g.237001  ORF Transcript_89174/g.237001 Transcript_89174/m.237001 type:complete len:258 (+) Transcript_89174:377-1150(+)